MRTVPLVGIEQTLGVVLVNATSVRLAPVLVRFEALGEFFCSVGVSRASQAGNGHYNAAPNVERSFSINYVYSGFFQSVDNTIWNSVQAGSAIPVKFSLNGNQV